MVAVTGDAVCPLVAVNVITHCNAVGSVLIEIHIKANWV